METSSTFAITLVTGPPPSGGEAAEASAAGGVAGDAVGSGTVGSHTSDSPGSVGTRLPTTGELVGNTYRLLDRLGEGAFGTVYEAVRTDMPEHRVALKLVPRSLWLGRDVDRELIMLAMVSHPHVVGLKDHGRTNAYIWFTMPLYHGETLANRLTRGPLTLLEAHAIFRAVAEGLLALHRAGLRHQDTKPSNIFLARFNTRIQPILLDLGVATESQSSFVAGTAAYCAPEQLQALLASQLHKKQGHNDQSQNDAALRAEVPALQAALQSPDLGPAMDTYCLATTLLEALIGPAAFQKLIPATLPALVSLQKQRARTPLPEAALTTLAPGIRSALHQRFGQWLAMAPADRPAMETVLEQLDVLLSEERARSEEERHRREAERRNVRRLRGAVIGLVGLGMVAAAIVVAKRRTLELASSLEAAQRSEAESFDRLDQCVTAQRSTKIRLSSCEARVNAEKTSASLERERITTELELLRQALADQRTLQADTEAASITALENQETLEPEPPSARALPADRETPPEPTPAAP